MRHHCSPRSMASAAMIVASVWLTGCASSTASQVDAARDRMRSGQLDGTCETLATALEQSAARPTRLRALRTWVDCLSRTGELRQARRWTGERPETADVLYTRALVEVAESPAAVPRAVSLLDRAADLWPEVGEIPYRAALLLLADEQPAPALKRLERAARAEETAAVAVARAHALLDLGQVQQSLVQGRRAVELDPAPRDIERGRALIQRIARRSGAVDEDLRARLRRAVELLGRRDQASKAIKEVEEILVDHPRLAAAHTVLGLAHLRLGNGADAVVALRKAAELNPLDATNPLYLAVLFQRMGRFDEAVRGYRRAVELDPFNARATRELGRLLLADKQRKEAARLLARAAKLDGGNESSLRLAGRAHLAAGSLEKAEAYYSRLLQQSPADFELNLRLGQILLRRYGTEDTGDRQLLERASDHLQRAAAVRPDDPELQALLEQLDAQ